MTPDQHASLNTALIGLALIVCGVIGKVAAAAGDRLIQMLSARVDRQAVKIDHLANGGGTAKIDARLRELGLLPPLQPGAATVQPYAPAQQATDAATTPQEGI